MYICHTLKRSGRRPQPPTEKIKNNRLDIYLETICVMKKLLIVMFVMSFSCAAMAASYDYLVLRQADGTETALPAVGLTITFTGGNAVAVASDGGTTTLPLSSLSAMYFGDTNTSIISTAAAVAADGPAVVYNIMGVKVAEGDSFKALKNGLQRGLYIVKTASGTFKTQVR